MPELTEQAILNDSVRMNLDSRFCFHCGPERECFNRCCADVTILLSPYDVLRLKKSLAIDSSEFLEKYTLTMRSRDRQVPVVLLRMGETDRKCPFVGESGCTVYNNRPWPCRMYPLGMAEPKGPNAAANRFYFLVEEELCQGRRDGKERTVRSWIDDQQIDTYDQMQGQFLELMSHPGWEATEPMSQEKLDMYFMALYDLDRFRRFVFDTRFLEIFDVDETRVEAIADDDEELLEFAIDWLAFSLFREKRMKLRSPAAEAHKAGPETEAMRQAGS
jgi:Fe-S-cluster containining protein